MNKLKQLSLLGVATAFILSSCSVEKRVHLAGYHIDWKKNKHGNTKIDVDQNTAANQAQFENKIVEETISPIESVNTVEQIVTASTENTIILPQTNKIDLNKKVVKSIVKNALKTSEGRNILKEAIKTNSKKDNSKKEDLSKGLVILLCIIIPFVAVGLMTDWDIEKVLINILWSLLCGIPGIIHAFIIAKREGYLD
jgi:uncharacterized membrane protein YqaE (UPF0057 family)